MAGAVNAAILAGLTDQQRREVLGACRRRRFRANEVVFHEGDPADTLHLVDRGHFAVRRTSRSGDDLILTVLGPGDAFGEMALLRREQRRSASVLALEPGETLSLHSGEFAWLRRRHPVVDEVLLRLAAQVIDRLSDHVLDALHVSADDRVTRRLAALCRVYDRGDGAVTIPITQQTLASMAGTTRPTANQALRQLETAGVIELRRGGVVVLDVDGLERRGRR